MALRLKSYRLDEETIEAICRLARAHGSQGKAIRAAILSLEGAADPAPSAEVIQPQLPAGFVAETISPERAAILRRLRRRMG